MLPDESTSDEHTETKSRMYNLEQRYLAAAADAGRLRNKVRELELQLKGRDQEIESMRQDLDRMGQKLVDEVELRAELQHGKDALQEEIEDLTKSLFEEANSMVADEAKQRHFHEQREKALKRQVEEVNALLEIERIQLTELRTLMEEMDEEQKQLVLRLAKYEPSVLTERSRRVAGPRDVSESSSTVEASSSSVGQIAPPASALARDFMRSGSAGGMSPMKRGSRRLPSPSVTGASSAVSSTVSSAAGDVHVSTATVTVATAAVATSTTPTAMTAVTATALAEATTTTTITKEETQEVPATTTTSSIKSEEVPSSEPIVEKTNAATESKEEEKEVLGTTGEAGVKSVEPSVEAEAGDGVETVLEEKKEETT